MSCSWYIPEHVIIHNLLSDGCDFILRLVISHVYLQWVYNKWRNFFVQSADQRSRHDWVKGSRSSTARGRGASRSSDSCRYGLASFEPRTKCDHEAPIKLSGNLRWILWPIYYTSHVHQIGLLISNRASRIFSFRVIFAKVTS